jgi:hypothetical protein
MLSSYGIGFCELMAARPLFAKLARIPPHGDPPLLATTENYSSTHLMKL